MRQSIGGLKYSTVWDTSYRIKAKMYNGSKRIKAKLIIERSVGNARMMDKIREVV